MFLGKEAIYHLRRRLPFAVFGGIGCLESIKQMQDLGFDKMENYGLGELPPASMERGGINIVYDLPSPKLSAMQ
jgi:hypothetical protein